MPQTSAVEAPADRGVTLATVETLLVQLLAERAAARSPWLTPAEVCHYFRWLDADGAPNLDQFYQARSRYGLPASRVGGTLRCHRQFLDAWVGGRPTPRAKEI